MTMLQKTLVIVAMVAAVGMGVYEARHAAFLRNQIQMLQRQQAFLTEEIRHLHFEHNDSASRQSWMSFTNSPAVSRETITGILTDPNFRVVIHALEQRTGVETLAEPEVVTTSGRGIQARYVWFNVPSFSAVTNSPPSSTAQH
jgi:Flp pilus assembly secretin CpaC